MTRVTSGLFSTRLVREVALPFVEFKPEGPAPTGGWPLILFLHGAGEKGVDGALLDQAALPRQLASGLDLNAIVLCPQCPPGPSWPLADLEAFLDAALARPDIDRDAVHLTGISMGARGAWDLAYGRGGDLASIVAVCGFGVPTLAPRLVALPAWLFHGEEDDIVPVARSTDMASALVAAGGDARLTVLPGQPHDCGETVYRDPALWRWVLSQRRRGASNEQ